MINLSYSMNRILTATCSDVATMTPTPFNC
jgi:hypothetical protein